MLCYIFLWSIFYWLVLFLFFCCILCWLSLLILLFWIPFQYSSKQNLRVFLVSKRYRIWRRNFKIIIFCFLFIFSETQKRKRKLHKCNVSFSLIGWTEITDILLRMKPKFKFHRVPFKSSQRLQLNVLYY